MGGGTLEAIVNPIGTGTKKATGSKTAGTIASPTGALAAETVGAVLPEPVVPGEVEALPLAPKASDPEVQAAKKKERKAARLRQGRQSTILSNLRRELSPRATIGGSQLG